MTMKAFQAAGVSITPVNGGNNGSTLCKSYDWDPVFACKDIPTEDFLENQVFWEDYLLLYVSASAVAGTAAYRRFVLQAVREGVDNGLFVVADLRNRAAVQAWADMAHIRWSNGPRLLPKTGNGRLSLSFANKGVLIDGKERHYYEDMCDGRVFMPAFLKSLINGTDLEDAVEAGRNNKI